MADPRYGHAHQQDREAWAPRVATGTVTCARVTTGECVARNPLIAPGDAWDLDHIHGTTHPAHARCNRRAGARYGNARREPHTLDW